MSAVIIDDGTLDTVVEYEGIRIRYSSDFRYSFDSDEEFLQATFEDFFNRQTDELDAIFESLSPEIGICYNYDCRSWISAGELEEYSTVTCLDCEKHKVLFKKMPEISDQQWKRLVAEATM